jgi:hypothetical protein
MLHTSFIDPKENTNDEQIVITETNSEEPITEKLDNGYNWDNSQGDLIMF